MKNKLVELSMFNVDVVIYYNKNCTKKAIAQSINKFTKSQIIMLLESSVNDRVLVKYLEHKNYSGKIYTRNRKLKSNQINIKYYNDKITISKNLMNSFERFTKAAFIDYLMFKK